MKLAITIIYALFLLASPAFAATFTWPSSMQPEIGDLAYASDGQLYEITGACSLQSPATLAAILIFTLNGVPCREFVYIDGNALQFLASGTYSDTNCTYTENISCPAVSSEAQDVPLDMGKALSFILGGLTGIGFVMASSNRWF